MSSPTRPARDVHLVDNGAGWRLGVVRHAPSGEPRGRPVLVVPGYGMNAFIFGFHPRGASLVDVLTSRGLEVWTVDLRGQGRSVRAQHGNHRYGMADLAIEDLGAAIRHVVRSTRAPVRAVDLVGCSLGATLAFTHLATVTDAPVHALVSMAGLVTWRNPNRLVKLAFGSPRLAGLLRMKNTRAIARVGLPVLSRVAPSLLGVYLNAKSTDLSKASRMVQTVEDPHPIINREIAEWLAREELVVRGVNVSRRLPELRQPFLCVVASQDGIVTPETARVPFEQMGSEVKRLLEVGSEETPIGHADLFVCNDAEDKVFTPLADFLIDV